MQGDDTARPQSSGALKAGMEEAVAFERVVFCHPDGSVEIRRKAVRVKWRPKKKED